MVRDRGLSIADEMWLRDEAPQEYIDEWYLHYHEYPPMVVLQGLGFGILTSSVINFAKMWTKKGSNPVQPSDVFGFLSSNEHPNKNEEEKFGFDDFLESKAERPT